MHSLCSQHVDMKINELTDPLGLVGLHGVILVREILKKEKKKCIIQATRVPSLRPHCNEALSRNINMHCKAD
jgi:hypothetical protein